MRHHLSLLALLTICTSAMAQLSDTKLMKFRALLCSNYVSYDVAVQSMWKADGGKSEYPTLTRTPEGYHEFYISHYGRHGSRYHYSAEDYKWIAETLEKAGRDSALTEFGDTLRIEMEKVRRDAHERAGDLTKLGRRQHQGIAERMVQNFPGVFTTGKKLDAKSTNVMRCAESMNSFLDVVQRRYPSIECEQDASTRYHHYLCHGKELGIFSGHDTLGGKLDQFYANRAYEGKLFERIFLKHRYVKENIDRDRFLQVLYYMCISLQGVDVDELDELSCTLSRVIEPEEMMKMWQKQNLYWYKDYANCPLNGGIGKNSARFLLHDVITKADEAISSGEYCANLRFGHDTGLLPFVALIGLDGSGKAIDDIEHLHNQWQDFSIIPMAGNVQMIFYRSTNPSRPILVKFLLNEREARLPIQAEQDCYYSWSDVKTYFESLIRQAGGIDE